MTRSSLILMTFLSSAALGQSLMGPGPVAILDGAAMRWLSIAYPEIVQLKVDPSRYTVEVVDRGDTMLVALSKPGNDLYRRGSAPGFPGVEIEIAKKDGKVVRSSFVR